MNKAQYLQKNRKQEIKQSNLTWTYLEAHQGYQPTCTARYCAAQLPVIFLPLAPKQLRAGHTCVDAGHLLLRAGGLSFVLIRAWRRHAPFWTPLTLFRASPTSSALSRATPEHTRRRRLLPPRPPTTPRPADESRSSAASSSTSSLSYTTPDALKPRQCRRFRPRLPEIPVVVSPDPVPPLPRQKHQKNRGEPLYHFPLTPCPISSSSRPLHWSRDTPPHELAAGVTPVTKQPRVCISCACHIA